MRVAVSLPGSFFGFFAHTGLVKALDRLGVQPCAVAGSSAGALVGALWAGGLAGEEIERLLLSLRRADFWEPRRGLSLGRAALAGFRGWTGLLTGSRFRDLLERTLPVRRFDECRFPLTVVSTDVTRRRRHVFRDGELAPAVAASCAYPLLFEPVEIGGSHHLDGGLVDKAPLDELAEERPEVILVHYLRTEDGEADGLFERPLTALHLLRRGFDIVREREFDLKRRWIESLGVRVALLEPSVPRVGPRRLAAGPAALAAAEAYAAAALPGILAAAPAQRAGAAGAVAGPPGSGGLDDIDA
jgi:NTE family protein